VIKSSCAVVFVMWGGCVEEEWALAQGGNYQSLMNKALAQFIAGQRLADVVRQTIRHKLQGRSGSLQQLYAGTLVGFCQ
jgi:hypothetical protein